MNLKGKGTRKCYWKVLIEKRLLQKASQDHSARKQGIPQEIPRVWSPQGSPNHVPGGGDRVRGDFEVRCQNLVLCKEIIHLQAVH